jgi:hypothetical protein
MHTLGALGPFCLPPGFSGVLTWGDRKSDE